MKWLLTTPKDADLNSVRREVEAAGGRIGSEEPVPQGEHEQVLYADGPDDLRERLAKTSLPIEAHPNSEMTFYKDGSQGSGDIF